MILALADRPGVYLVPSADGERSYEVNARERLCQCKDWVYRQSERGGLCRHVLALLAHLEALAACPACSGRGLLAPRLLYASGSEPLVCSTCMGSGRRDKADPRLLAVADAYRVQESQP